LRLELGSLGGIIPHLNYELFRGRIGLVPQGKFKVKGLPRGFRGRPFYQGNGAQKVGFQTGPIKKGRFI